MSLAMLHHITHKYNQQHNQSQIKISLIIIAVYFAKACNEFEGLISASLHPSNKASFEEIL